MDNTTTLKSDYALPTFTVSDSSPFSIEDGTEAGAQVVPAPGSLTLILTATPFGLIALAWPRWRAGGLGGLPTTA